MGRLKVTRRGPGRPSTRPGPVLGDKAYSSTAIRAHLRQTRDQGDHPRTRGPDPQPAPARQPGRPAARLRPRRLQAAQHRRARLLPAPPAPRRRHPVRQTRLHLARNRRRRLDPDLALVTRCRGAGPGYSTAPAGTSPRPPPAWPRACATSQSCAPPLTASASPAPSLVMSGATAPSRLTIPGPDGAPSGSTRCRSALCSLTGAPGPPPRTCGQGGAGDAYSRLLRPPMIVSPSSSSHGPEL